MDFEKLKKITNTTKVSIASREEVIAVTGVVPGCVCVVSLDIPVIFDKEVLNFEKVNFGSGDLFYGIEMNPQDILKIVNASAEDVVSE